MQDDKHSSFTAGIARIDITPPVGTELAGGAFGPAAGVHRPLHATAIAMGLGDRWALLISCDLLGLDSALAERIRERIALEAGIAREAVMLACTHTHGGPATMHLRHWGRQDPQYVDGLVEQLVEVAKAALADRRLAQIGVGSAQCPDASVNRAFDDGLNDPGVGIIRIDDGHGYARAVVVNFACHPVNMHGAGRISPDFPAFIEDTIREGLGHDLPVLFLQGALGDVNPANFTPGKPSEHNARETGRMIGQAVLDALPHLEPTTPDVLDWCEHAVTVAHQPLPPREELEKLIAEIEPQLAQRERKASDWDWCNLATKLDWAREALGAVERGDLTPQSTLRLSSLRIGPIAIVGIPGEPYCEYGMRIARSGLAPHVLTSTLTNGMHGYFPSPAAYEAGRYEAVFAPRVLGLYAFESNVGEQVCRTGQDVLRRLMPHQRNAESRRLWQRACSIIVGGGQAHKRPVRALMRGGPAFATSARGSRFTDIDGNEYIDYLLSYGPIVLGHADPAVNAAVQRQMEAGTLYSIEHPLSIEVAETLCELVPCAERAMYFIGGSAATSGALRCARAHTGREKIIRCGYHGWHDWCVPHNPGVPRHERELMLEVPYNDAAALEQRLEAEAGNVAGVIIEAVQGEGPAPGYFDRIRELCDEQGAVFILDEIKTGFRFDLGGAQVPLGIRPDLATFGKAMCNGYPAAVLVGRAGVMADRTDTYMAATFHADALSLVAAKTVIEQMKSRDGIAHFQRLGRRLIDGFNAIFEDTGLPARMAGDPAMPTPVENGVDHPDRPTTPAMGGQVLIEFCTALQRRGIYGTPHPWFLSLAHTEADIEQTLTAAAEAAEETVHHLQRLTQPAPPVGHPARA